MTTENKAEIKMSVVKVYLIPLINGNFNKETFQDSEEKYYCCDFSLEESTTFEDLLNHQEISEKLQHLSNIEKAITVHDKFYGYSSHGPVSLMRKLDNKIESRSEQLYIVYPSVEDTNATIYPPDLEIIPEKTPLILLDIDGIINEFGSDDKNLEKVHVMLNFQAFEIKYNPEKIRKINEWARYAEVRFLTSWGNCATYRIAPTVGLFSFPHNYTSKHRLYQLSEEDSKRPIIWIDDEIGGRYPYPDDFKEIAGQLDNVHIMYVPSYLQSYHFEYVQKMINPENSDINLVKLIDSYISDYMSKENGEISHDDIYIILNNFRKLAQHIMSCA